ncbi:unnamed protein product [Didymodactylos carnosus]|uniref:Uncharacterized protein n=1 Tax=Didymodactylos carnosus TaxID=1234261 RepID=A0A813PMV8_9BILA|nr:unnamed protein product [Didymodactylos carnosus]CAF0755170.1 unnamed protein product [Didymodactylos carnosus]CAF3523110.1 unnamed protein product [Didymodactylos carnosus]CAF3535439.1 unnamed protein product [Didymodactylos carnosus]
MVMHEVTSLSSFGLCKKSDSRSLADGTDSFISEGDTTTPGEIIEDISFQTVRDVLHASESNRTIVEQKKLLIEDFRTRPFEELKSKVSEKQRLADERLTDHLMSVLCLSKDSNESTPKIEKQPLQFRTSEFQYPELFTY